MAYLAFRLGSATATQINTGDNSQRNLIAWLWLRILSGPASIQSGISNSNQETIAPTICSACTFEDETPEHKHVSHVFWFAQISEKIPTYMSNADGGGRGGGKGGRRGGRGEDEGGDTHGGWRIGCDERRGRTKNWPLTTSRAGRSKG